MFGFLIIFFLFIANPSVRAFFQTTMTDMLRALHVSPGLASQGLSEFMFWIS
jgi:hypothetical protein